MRRLALSGAVLTVTSLKGPLGADIVADCVKSSFLNDLETDSITATLFAFKRRACDFAVQPARQAAGDIPTLSWGSGLFSVFAAGFRPRLGDPER